jgi:hypothetical protein
LLFETLGQPSILFSGSGRVAAVTNPFFGGTAVDYYVCGIDTSERRKIFSRTLKRFNFRDGNLSDDGRILLLNSHDRPSIVIDTQTGGTICEIAHNKHKFRQLSPDGRRALTLSASGQIALIDIDTKAERALFQRSVGARFRCAQFSYDGTMVVTITDQDAQKRSIEVWDSTSGRRIAAIPGDGSAYGIRGVTNSSFPIVGYNTPRGRIVRSHTDNVWFHPDGTMIFSAWESTLSSLGRTKMGFAFGYGITDKLLGPPAKEHVLCAWSIGRLPALVGKPQEVLAASLIASTRMLSQSSANVSVMDELQRLQQPFLKLLSPEERTQAERLAKLLMD